MQANRVTNMKRYVVECTVVYNGSIEVEADNEQEAIEKASNELGGKNLDSFPNEVTAGDATFMFGEATADYGYEL